MRRKKASSSNVISYAYSASTLELEVEFAGNRVYTYEGISPFMAAQFESAPSKGAFVDAYLRGLPFHRGESSSQANESPGLLPDMLDLAFDALRPAEIPSPPPIAAQVQPDQT